MRELVMLGKQFIRVARTDPRAPVMKQERTSGAFERRRRMDSKVENALSPSNGSTGRHTRRLWFAVMLEKKRNHPHWPSCELGSPTIERRFLGPGNDGLVFADSVQ